MQSTVFNSFVKFRYWGLPHSYNPVCTLKFYRPINSFYLLQPSGYFTYYPIQHSNILHGAHIAFRCCTFFSEQTATFALYNIN